MLQALKEHPSERGLRAYDGQRVLAHTVDGMAQRMALARARLLPAGMNSRKIGEHIVALEPAIALADGIARRHEGFHVVAIGYLEPREQLL